MHGSYGQKFAQNRNFAEHLDVVQVIGKHDHDRRGGHADQEGKLGDVDSPGNVPAHAGNRETPVPLSEVGRKTKPHQDEQDPK